MLWNLLELLRRGGGRGKEGVLEVNRWIALICTTHSDARNSHALGARGLLRSDELPKTLGRSLYSILIC